MLWQRSAPLQSIREGRPSVPGSDAVRLAALQASWRRDRLVAQRRIVWRWAVWYAQRWTPPAIAAVLVLLGIAYLSGSLPIGAQHSTHGEIAEKPVHQTPASSAPLFVEPTALTLRASLLLQAQRPSRPMLPAEAQASPDTLTLQPENWLHSKEP